MNTCLAAIAIWHIGDILAAAKPVFQKTVDHLRGFIDGQVGKNLSFLPTLEIRTRLRSGYIKLGKTPALLSHALRLTLLFPNLILLLSFY